MRLLKNYKILKVLSLIILLLIFFIYGIFVGKYELPPHNFLYTTKNFVLNKNINNLTANFESCEIEPISYIPRGSLAFIGHAYGSPRFSDPKRFIAPKIENFIKDNKHLLKSIIFTGDVFDFPSLEKWAKLSSITSGTNVEIALGNHDYIRPDSKDIFEVSIFGKKEYPYEINSSSQASQAILIDDSVSSNWVVSEDVAHKLIQSNARQIIIARHNIPIIELLPYSNSKTGFDKNLDTIQSLQKKSGMSQYIWIIGDGGAFSELPRLKCLKNDNHTFVINGIGELDGDSIILEFNGKIYSFIL